MSLDEGYIKFECEWEQTPLPPWTAVESFLALRQSRARMMKRGWVGQYEAGPLAGVGFGNLSIRGQEGSFWITASATGGFHELSPGHVSVVTGFDVEQNRVFCVGEMKASSESMTHAVVYRALPQVGGIVHVHSMDLWKACLDDDSVPKTGADVPYGTPEMAFEMERILKDPSQAERRVVAMAGHEEGIIAFGATLEEAEAALVELAERLL